MLKTAISSRWSLLLNLLAALREKFLQNMGKFLDWLWNRKNKSTSAGRPTVDDNWLSTHRDSLVDMLSCWWGEVGSQLTRATTREDLRAALEPLREHPNRHRISRLMLVSSDPATSEQIREGRQENGRLIAAIYEASERQRDCVNLVSQAEIAVGQASPEKKEAVEAHLSKRKADLQTANSTYEAASAAQQAHEKKLDQMEAGFAQDELLMFIDKRFINGRYARNPRNLADAMAGLPYTQGVHFMGAWQSYARCSKLFCPPHHQSQVFETIQSIWKKLQKSKLPPVEFFHQEITALPRTVVLDTVDPVTKKEVQTKSDNLVRSSMLEYWPIWSLAIEKSLASPVEPERTPFVIFSNFKKVQSDPQTYVHLVLGSTEKAEN
ncbi:MAG: hypothetical protein WAQ52_05185 [Terriglobales bacterium]